VIPRFMLHLFQQSAVRAMLSGIASGTGGSMKNISQAKLKQLQLPVPPLDLQRKFTTKAEAIRAIANQQDAALDKAQASFDALLHRAFAHYPGPAASGEPDNTDVQVVIPAKVGIHGRQGHGRTTSMD